MRHHPLRLANRRQVVRRGSISRGARCTRASSSRAPRGNATAAPDSRQPHEARVDDRPRVDHAERRFGSADAPSPASPAPLAKPRFRCTSSSEIAAGVTPEMRAAWPIVSGLCRLSFCCTSVGESAHRAVVEIARAARGFLAAALRAISSLLPVDVARVLGRDLDLLGDERIGDRRRPRRAASSATHRSTPGRRSSSASVYSRSIGWPSTRSASCRGDDCGIDRRRLQALQLARDRVALARERVPARIVDDAELAAVLGQAQVRVVFAQLQPVLGARREHPVRLGDAARDEVVDQHAEIGFVAARRPAVLAAHEARRVDAGEQALRRRFLVAGRAVDLAREEEPADRLGLERRLAARADRSSRIRSSSRDAGCARARSP